MFVKCIKQLHYFFCFTITTNPNKKFIELLLGKQEVKVRPVTNVSLKY